MTVGNIVEDNRTTVFTNYGSYPSGTLFTREWAGGDRTAEDRAAGRWPDHAYSTYRRTEFFGSFHNRHTQEFGNLLLDEGRIGLPSPFLGPLNSPSSNADLTALSRVANTMRGHDWNVGVFTAEMGKTTDTVVTRMKQFAQAVTQTRRGNISNAVKILAAKPLLNPKKRKDRRVANWYETWLELRYAWRPLIKDIFDLSEAIRLLDKPRKKVVRGSFKEDQQWVSNYPQWFNIEGGGVFQTAYKYTITEAINTDLPTYLGLVDPEEVVWEIMPYSFVADWFIPIGTFIRTRNVLNKSNGIWVKTVKSVADFKMAGDSGVQQGPGSAYEYVMRSDPTGSLREVRLTRTVGTLSPAVPLPSFRNPAGSNPGSRALDAIALITSVVQGSGFSKTEAR